MLTAAPVHPSKKVAFAELDSDEEGERSRRGIEFRRKLKEDSQLKKMAAQQARQAADLDLAGRVYGALILPTNQGGLDDLARDPNSAFFAHFELFYRDLVASALGHVPNRNTRGGTSVMLGRIARSGITFQQIQQHPLLVEHLGTIGGNFSFRDAFLVRREGHVSSESSEDGSAGPVPAQVQPPAQAQGRRHDRRPRVEDDPQATRRQRQRRH